MKIGMGLGKTMSLIALINRQHDIALAKLHGDNDKAKELATVESPTPLSVTSNNRRPSLDYDNNINNKDSASESEFEEKKSRRRGSSSSAGTEFPEETEEDVDETGRVKTRATLVVGPVSLLGQWMNELKNRSSRKMKILSFYSSNRPKLMKKMLNYDVIITSYGVLASEMNLAKKRMQEVAHKTPWLFAGEHAPQYKSLLHRMQFNRVILDESHVIRTGGTLQARSAYELVGHSKYLMSGTPVATSLNDLQGQARFLELKGLVGEFWNVVEKIITRRLTTEGMKQTPIKAVQHQHRITNTLLTLLTHNMIRHNKDQKFNGRPTLLVLPERSVETLNIDFTESERKMYNEQYNHAKERFQRFKEQNVAVRRTIEILQMIQPLRQMSSAMSISRTAWRQRMATEIETDRERKSLDEAQAKLKADDWKADDIKTASKAAFQAVDSECSICIELLEDPVQTLCGHLFCSQCVRSLLSTGGGQKNCPLCREMIRSNQLFKPRSENDEGELEALPDDMGDADDSNEEKKTSTDDEKKDSAEEKMPSEDMIHFGSKLKVLIKELRKLRRENSSTKALVFTQFHESMELIKKSLEAESIHYSSIEGHMTMQRRKKNMEMFSDDPDCSVFLLSVRAGAVGLTLTAASHVFMFEPCINPALELQAIGRVHRLGQTKQVIVKYLIMRGSVEENIMRINKEKLAHAPAVDYEEAERRAGVRAKEEEERKQKLAEELASFPPGRAGNRMRRAQERLHQQRLRQERASERETGAAAGSILSDQSGALRLEELEKLFAIPESNPAEEKQNEPAMEDDEEQHDEENSNGNLNSSNSSNNNNNPANSDSNKNSGEEGSDLDLAYSGRTLSLRKRKKSFSYTEPADEEFEKVNNSANNNSRNNKRNKVNNSS
jgi:SNF2 family DNA or RNA helicase